MIPREFTAVAQLRMRGGMLSGTAKEWQGALVVVISTHVYTSWCTHADETAG
jgi:hypothetical protein